MTLTAAMLTLGALGAGATTATTTINVDDPARVSVTVDGTEQALVAGDNEFSVTDGSADIRIKPQEGNILLSVVQQADWGDSPCYLSEGAYSFQISSDYSWALNTKYTVTSANLADFRDASCTVTITDDPALVRLQRSYDSEPLPLVAGPNTVAFNAENETITLSPAQDNPELPLYQVLVNGEAVGTGSSYSTSHVLTLKDGDQVDVTAAWPDTQCHVAFVFPEDTDPAVISRVMNNRTEQDYAFDANGFDVKCGTNVRVTLNNLYEVKELVVNGETLNLYGGNEFSLLVVQDGEISVTAAPYQLVRATVNVDDPEAVVVYRGYSYENDVVQGLKAGDNEVELLPTNATLTLRAADGYYLDAVADGEGNDLLASAYSNEEISIYDVADGMVVTVKTARKVRDQKFAIFAQKINEENISYQYSQRNDGSQFEIADGYTVVPFNKETEVPVRIGLSSSKDFKVVMVLNDQAVDSPYGASWELTPNDGDVAYIFFFFKGEDYTDDDAVVSAPEKVAVSFEGECQGLEVTRDVIVPVQDWAEGFEAYPGTRVSLAGVGHNTVTVNGVAATPDAEGNYDIDVPAQGAKIAFAATTGVESVEAGARAASGIYNLQGMRLNTGRDQLPAGVYVIDGKKVRVNR